MRLRRPVGNGGQRSAFKDPLRTILFALLFVFFRVRQGFGLGTFTLPQLFQERSAPTATGPGTKALRQLRRRLRLMGANKLHDLAPRNMKAQADRLVFVHARSSPQIKAVAIAQAS